MIDSCLYPITDKRRLYWLMHKYLNKDITDEIFCDEFYYCYDLELDKTTLTESEKQTLFSLNQVISRFSKYEQDHLIDNRAFSTITELKEKVKEVVNILKV